MTERTAFGILHTNWYVRMKTQTVDSPTKERLLDAALGLMLAKGFSATTVDEICGRAKLTKGSFFHYFESKDQIGEVLLERFCCRAEALHAACVGSETDPLARVYNYIDGLIKLAGDPAMERGCLLGMFAQELSREQPKIRGVCAKGFEGWEKHFGKELAQAKRVYAPKAGFDPRSVAQHLIAVLEGALILAKVKGNAAPVTSSLKHFRRYVESLF